MLADRAGQMVIFAALVQHHSFTVAAKQLGVSVSHVSKQLALLEAALGLKLVQRTTRSLILTDAGQRFAIHCQQLVRLVDEAQCEVDSQRDEVAGLLRLGLSQSFGTLHILPTLEELRQRYPELQVEVHLFDHRVDMLQEGLDLWITSNERLPQGYIAQRLADCRFLVVAAPEYLLRHRAPHTPEDLIHHNCLIYRSWDRDYTRWSFAKAQQKMTVQVSGNYSVDLAEAVRDAAVAGWGVAYLATYLLKDEFRHGQLIQLLPDWHANQSMPFYAVYPSRQHMPKKISAVIDFIKGKLASPCYWDTRLEPYVTLSSL